MSRLVLVFLLAALATSAVQSTSSSTQIPITVYYESLCTDSMKFFLEDLVPTFNHKDYDFASLLSNITLVPYGNVKVIDANNYRYVCQHGPSECEGNKLHGCAVKYFADKRKLLSYIGCLMEKSSKLPSWRNPFPVNECIGEIPEEILSKIVNCYNSNEGWDEFNRNGYHSNMAFGKTRVFIPLITFHKVTDENTSKRAFTNFKNTLCSMYSLRNKACNNEWD